MKGSRNQKINFLWLGVALILAFWLTRLLAIGVFPPFLDEAVHIHFGELSRQTSVLAFAAEGRLFTVWWYMLFQPHLAGGVWLVRVATVLAVLPGFAAGIGIGRMAAGVWGGVLAGLIYLFSTYHLFYERLALSDSISGAAITLGLYFAFRLSRRANLWDAMLAGIMIFVAIGFKISALPYLGIPLAAFITLRPPLKKAYLLETYPHPPAGTSVGRPAPSPTGTSVGRPLHGSHSDTFKGAAHPHPLTPSPTGTSVGRPLHGEGEQNRRNYPPNSLSPQKASESQPLHGEGEKRRLFKGESNVEFQTWLHLTLPQGVNDLWRWLVVALAVEVGLTGIFALGLRVLDYNLFYLIGMHNPNVGEGILARIINNAGNMVVGLSAYTGTAVFLLLMTGGVVLALRRHFYLPLCLLAPLVILWVSERQSTRFYIAPMTILLLCGAVVLAVAIRQRRVTARLGLALVLIWGLVQWLPFAWTASRDALNLNLPAADQSEYMLSDASGFGLAEVYQALIDQQPRQVLGLLSNCQSLRYMALGRFSVTCPRVNPNGSDVATLGMLMVENRAEGIYVVLEDSAYVPAEAPGRHVTTIEHASGRPRLSIYDLAP